MLLFIPHCLCARAARIKRIPDLCNIGDISKLEQSITFNAFK
jgi:hypothetical protein